MQAAYKAPPPQNLPKVVQSPNVCEASIDTGLDLLWLVLGPCALVLFVFFILARHWQKILQRQTLAIRQLTRRMQDLEALGDPAFRRRLEKSAPLPLEQVFALTFRFSKAFWKDTLGLGEEDERFIHNFGSFVGSVKLERWRGHTVANVTEVLPASQSARWQTRTVLFFSTPSASDSSAKLWELFLNPPASHLQRADLLELQIVSRGTCDFLELSVRDSREDAASLHVAHDPLFAIPLDRAMLAAYRSPEPVLDATTGANVSESAMPAVECSWKGFYSFHDEALGIEWQLWMQDLTQKAEWERWKILDAARAS